MNYQDVGGPTPQNLFPTGDSAKLDTSLSDAQKRKVDMVFRVMRKHRKEKQVKDIQEVTKKIVALGGFMYKEADRPRKTKHKGQRAKTEKTYLSV